MTIFWNIRLVDNVIGASTSELYVAAWVVFVSTVFLPGLEIDATPTSLVRKLGLVQFDILDWQ